MLLLVGCATTRLQNAIIRGDTNKAVQLAESDERQINKKNSAGKTALILASIRVQEDVVRSILKAGGDPNITDSVSGISALSQAAYQGVPSLVDILLEHGAKIDLPSKKGLTPLHFATIKQFYPVIKQLVQKGTDVNYPNHDGVTPLFIACSEGYTAIVEYLLLHGANPNIQDKNAKTPLMQAVSGNHYKIAQLLILHGADIITLSQDQKTAQDIAEENGSVRLVELLDENVTVRNIVSESKKSHMKIIVNAISGQINGNNIVPSSRRGWELRTAQGHFLDMLSESNLFSGVDVGDKEYGMDEKIISATLKVDEVENMHTGANVGKAMLVGFFTLGLAPAPANYSYASKATLVIERFDGEKREYSATADTTSNWVGDPRSQNYIKKSGNARKTARRLVTQQVLESLISQIETDDNFFETP